MEFLGRIFEALFVLHPLHPMIVHFPIALTAVAALFVVLARWRKSEGLDLAAFYCTSLAAVSTLVAGVTGMRDNNMLYDGTAPNANAKIFLGVTLLLLTTATALVRWRRKDVLWEPGTTIAYIAAHVVSFALAAVLGFLGGVILYGF
jgi:uncharacterized membrane protein